MSSSFNILNRPKRAIHGKKLVITEELAKLIGKGYNSESDEEFIPQKQIKSNKKDDDDDDDDDEKEEEDDNEDNESKSNTDDSSSTLVKTIDDKEELESEDDDDDDESDTTETESDKNDTNNGSDNEIESSTNNETINSNKQTKPKNSNKKLKRKTKEQKSPKKPTKKKQEKNTTTTNDPKSKLNIKKKREYNKRKKLHQQKINELKSENKKILDKLSSRLKSSTTTKSTICNGPVVRLDKAIVDKQTYPIYIISNNRDINDDSQNQNNKKSEINSIKIPKEKIPTVLDPKGPWICKLCLNRPNYLNLGDLYGPYLINNGFDNDQEDGIEHNKVQAWMHESCIVWTPNVYIEDNKLFGLSDAINLALTNDCSLCKKPGASLICSKNSCKISYHYPCALNSKCKFDDENFTIFCNKHS